MGDDSEWMKLPTDEKVQHKVWKARLAGYEEATKLFGGLEEKSPEFSKYAGLIRKFVIDSNAVAQEKALDAVLIFVENAHVAGRTCAEVMTGIITKCLNASKQKTKDKSIDIIMLYIEIEKQEQVQEALMTGLDNKQPKIVVGCISVIRQALRDFGTKIVSVKPIIKVLPKLLEDRDKNVREETKLLCIELYRWIGAALKPQMTHFKPVQVQELEAEFEKLPAEKAKQCKFLRSQQELKTKMEEEAVSAEGGGAGDAEDDGTEEIDAYELIPEVDILSLLPKDFYDKIEAKKWQERKEVLEALQKLTTNPKIENGDFGTLIKCILKVIAKDSNVMLVALAGKCLHGLAAGLRKKFTPYAANSLSTIIDKFKEKKLAVVTALREASDAVFISMTLESMSEDCVAALENKNPQIRAETALLLGRCFSKSTLTNLPKKLLKLYCGSLLKTVNDTTGEVREASFQALGMAMRVVTEKHISPFLVDVDNIKMAKITECCNNAVLLNSKGEPRSGGGGAAAKPVAKPASDPKVVKPKAAKVETASKPAKTVIGGKKKVVAGKGGNKGKKSGGKEEVVENTLSDEVVEEKAEALLPGDTLAGLVSSNWKERLASMEKLTQVVKGLCKDDIPCQVCVRVIDKKPGLKDTNFQVLKLKLELIAHLAQNSVFSKKSAEFCVTEIVDKVGDVKNSGAAQEALSCMSEALGLDYVSQEVVRLAFVQKNPKNQSEALNWLALSIKEFGFKINIKPMLETIKKAFAATNPVVRTAAISLLGVVYMYMGATLRVLFDNEKPALLQQIDAEFEKVKGEKPPAPTRGLKPSTPGDGDDEEEATEDVQDIPVEDLVPRTDIIEKITPELLEEMADKNWKVRGEALGKVTAMLKEAHHITPNIGSLPESLKLRLSDSNKIMVTTTIGICQSLGQALGPHCKNHIRVIGPGLIGCMGDSKPQVRTAATNALNIWVDQTTLTPLVECEALCDYLKLENPNLRAELLSWLTEKLPSHRVLPTEIRQCIPNVLACLEDRNGDVRKKAQDSLVPFMIHTGYDSFLKASSKLKPASKDQIMAILEKARGNLPAKAPKSKKPTAAAPVQQPAVAANSRFDDDTEDKPAAAKETKKETGKKVGKGKAKPAASSGKKKEEEDFSPVMNLTVPKEQRFKDERTLKVLKWNFTDVRPEIVEQLNLQMEKNFNKTIMNNLFHKDFKFHTKAIELLIKGLDNLPDETIGNLDLILKWFTLRFYDTNPSMLNKALSYLQDLFSLLASEDYHLHDLEASAFIPYVIIKVGDSKDNVRRDVRKIFKLICQVYPASKMFSHLIDGLKSKNSKQRAECLEELGCLIESFGISICQPSPAQALKAIAQQISDRDNSVRNAALNTIVIAYGLIDEQVFKYLGNLSDKDMSFLQERLKKAASKPKGPKINDERPQTARPALKLQQQQTEVHRPQTAPSKSHGNKRQFLDIECEPSDDLSTPSLIDVDMDDIYDSLPSPATTVKPRPLSTTIGYVISQITNKNINTCIQALAQIDEVLKDRSEILLEHVDQLVLLLSMQFKMVYSTCMGDDNTSKDDIIRLYRCLLCTLLATFQHEDLAKKASRDILKDILNSLVTMLLDSRLMDLEEGPQVVRTVNVTVIKIVENADYANIMSALISLLQDCSGSETCTPKFLELIMKCLWRLMRTLPDTINELNIDRTLLDCHLFLRAFPSSSWKERSSDLPLRTIKTILHSLATLKGKKIFSHTGLISSTENSEIEAYLQKVLKNDVASTNAKNEEMNTEEKPKSKKVSFSKGTQDTLGEIFKKIGSKENTKEGLNDLFDFKKKHPESDLMPFLKKTSQFFQDYVERGLKNIDQERKGNKLNTDNAEDSINTSNNSSPATAVQTDSTANFYLERLKAIRSQCGLDNNSTSQQSEKPQPLQPLKLFESENNSTCSSTESLEINEYKPGEEDTENRAAAPVDVSGLKMRLERIKQLSNKN